MREIPAELRTTRPSVDQEWRTQEYNTLMSDEAREKRMREKEINSGIYREKDAAAKKRIEDNLIEVYRFAKDMDWNCREVNRCEECPALVPPEHCKDDPSIVGRCVITWLSAKYRKRYG